MANHNGAIRFGRPAIVTLLVAVLSCATASAGETVVWNFDIATTGNDVSWRSATAVNNTRPLYDTLYEITLLEINVRYLIFNLGPFDITDQIPPELRSGSGTLEGPPPITLVDQRVTFPEPPEPTAFAADLFMGVDADGFGFASLTNVVLGTIEIDLGPPFGRQTVQLTRVRIAGRVEVTPRIPGDLDGDDDVDLTDLGILLMDYGCVAPDCPGDADGDGDTDLADLGIVLMNFGT